MSHAALHHRLQKLEQAVKVRPELRSFVMMPGETWGDLSARATAWRAERPAARRVTVRLIGCREEAEL
jgi:hypothetical protein